MTSLHAALAALADANDIRLGKSGAAAYTGIGSDAIRALLAEYPPTPAPEGTERIEWGIRQRGQEVKLSSEVGARRAMEVFGGTLIRRVVGEWEPVEETQP